VVGDAFEVVLPAGAPPARFVWADLVNCVAPDCDPTEPIPPLDPGFPTNAWSKKMVGSGVPFDSMTGFGSEPPEGHVYLPFTLTMTRK